MQIGFNAPTTGPLIDPDSLSRIVTEGEALGFDYITISDHIMVPRNLQSKYPYTGTGEFPAGASAAWLEQLTTTAYVAALTKRLRFVLSVMVVPHRPAVLTAKVLSTIDWLSRGRLTLGIGVGWCREEFEAIGAAPFDDRGNVTDEWMAACRELWSAGHAIGRSVNSNLQAVAANGEIQSSGHAERIYRSDSERNASVNGDSGPCIARGIRWVQPVGQSGTERLAANRSYRRPCRIDFECKCAGDRRIERRLCDICQRRHHAAPGDTGAGDHPVHSALQDQNRAASHGSDARRDRTGDGNECATGKERERRIRR